MKTTSDHLFKLVKSLSGSEKRYFVRHSKLHVRNDQNNYSKLFTAIDSQKEYDENALLRKFSKEAFINQFWVAKNYLYNAVLESLDSYHGDSNSEIRGMLNKIEILVERGLLVQAKKLLKKAKAMAILHEKLIYIYEISTLENSVYRLGLEADDLKSDFDKQNKEINYSFSQIENFRKYKVIRDKLLAQSNNSGVMREEKDIKSYEWFLKEPLMKNEKLALSVNAQILYFESYCRYFDMKGDAKKAYEFSSKRIKLLGKSPKVIEDNIFYPSKFLWYHGISCLNIGKYQESLDCFSKMELIHPKSNSRKADIQLKVYTGKLNVYFIMGNMKKCLQLISGMEPILEKNKDVDKVSKQGAYRYISYLLFQAGQFKESLRWIVKGNLSDNYTSRPDIECIVRIMEIALYYELGKYDIMESRIKSVERFLSGKQKMYQMEKNILKYLRKLIHVNSKQESIPFFKEFKKALEVMAEEPAGKNFITFFDIISWIESKIEDKKFDDIVKGKIKVQV